MGLSFFFHLSHNEAEISIPVSMGNQRIRRKYLLFFFFLLLWISLNKPCWEENFTSLLYVGEHYVRILSWLTESVNREEGDEKSWEPESGTHSR